VFKVEIKNRNKSITIIFEQEMYGSTTRGRLSITASDGANQLCIGLFSFVK